MSRLSIPELIAVTRAGSQPMFEAAKKQLRVVANLFRLVVDSPAALEGYLALSDALALVSPAARWITGAAMRVDGGKTHAVF